MSVVYYKSKHRVNRTRRCGNRHVRPGRLLPVLCDGDPRFERSQKLSSVIRDLPTVIVPQHKTVGKNIDLWRASCQPPHPVGLIRSA